MQLKHKLFSTYGNLDILKTISSGVELFELLETIINEERRKEDYQLYCSIFLELKERDFEKFTRVKNKSIFEKKTKKVELTNKEKQMNTLKEVATILKCKR